MPTFRTATVVEVLEERPGLQRLRVRLDDPTAEGDRAYCLTRVLGEILEGDRVVLNTTAVELGLGTGGWHVVHWNLARDTLEVPGPDHVMKMRYTSLQLDAGTDELAHPELPGRLDGVPVVVCGVHSQVGVVAASVKVSAPTLSLGYVMTDGAALPIALSDLVADLQDRGLLDLTVTTGHAFGGDLEAVTVASGLLLARHVGRCDVLVVGMGPGVVGTGTAFGNTGVEVGPIIDLVAALGGAPVLCVRASSGDPRDRHRGVSHHTRTAMSLSHGGAWVAAVPEAAAELPGVRVRPVVAPSGAEVLGLAGLAVTTMGRGVAEDPLFFDAAAAAGAVAVDLATSP